MQQLFELTTISKFNEVKGQHPPLATALIEQKGFAITLSDILPKILLLTEGFNLKLRNLSNDFKNIYDQRLHERVISVQ